MELSKEIEELAKYETRGTIRYDIKIRLAERARELEEGQKELTVRFFQWWWNQPGTNTNSGYDEWVEKGRPSA